MFASNSLSFAIDARRAPVGFEHAVVMLIDIVEDEGNGSAYHRAGRVRRLKKSPIVGEWGEKTLFPQPPALALPNA